MDTRTVRTYSDTPDGLEKGGFETHPLHPDAGHACSVQTRSRRSLVKHPWIVFGTVALTWLLFSCGKYIFSRPPHGWHWAGNMMEFSPPAHEDRDRCVYNANWTAYYDQPPWSPDYPSGAETTLSLPLDSDALYLFSRGPSQQGLVSIEQSTKVTDTVDVRVRVAYYDAEALERVTVCRMQRAETENGIGIFTRWWRPHPLHHSEPEGPFRFDVTLTLPAGAKGPLSVKNLESRMPNYDHAVADLQESVLFDRISLVSANGGLSIESVTCEAGQFSSLNGEVHGNFNARSSLDLHTSNGHITPTVNMLHREAMDPSNLIIHTINGKIDADVSLTSEALMGGEFGVDVKSVNGEIGLKFTKTPVDSVLQCRTETIVGGIEVELDSAFEGGYSLQSISGKKVVSQHDVEDPAGKGRHRVISQSDSFARAEGDVKWVEDNGSSSGIEGYVTLMAVASSVKLLV